MSIGIVIALLVRVTLVILFFPCSALDKLLNFRGAVGQAQEMAPGALGVLLILIGLSVEFFGSLAILTGIADRAAAFIMAGYCGTTALLWKQFWVTGDFWAGSDSKGRQLFWDFLKNFALAGGFLLVTFGLTAGSVGGFFEHPLSSTHPYTQAVP